MKYPAHIYAKALAEVITDANAKNEREAEKNFLSLLRKNGDESHLRKIVEEAARFARGKRGIRKVIIESARPLKESQRKTMRYLIKENDIIEEKIVPDLVAGVRIVVNDELQFDGSLKSKLNAIFGN